MCEGEDALVDYSHKEALPLDPHEGEEVLGTFKTAARPKCDGLRRSAGAWKGLLNAVSLEARLPRSASRMRLWRSAKEEPSYSAPSSVRSGSTYSWPLEIGVGVSILVSQAGRRRPNVWRNALGGHFDPVATDVVVNKLRKFQTPERCVDAHGLRVPADALRQCLEACSSPLYSRPSHVFYSNCPRVLILSLP